MSPVLLDLREYDRCERAYVLVPPDPFVVAETRLQLLKRERELRPPVSEEDPEPDERL